MATSSRLRWPVTTQERRTLPFRSNKCRPIPLKLLLSWLMLSEGCHGFSLKPPSGVQRHTSIRRSQNFDDASRRQTTLDLTSTGQDDDGDENSIDAATKESYTKRRDVTGVTLKIAVDANGSAGETLLLNRTMPNPPTSIRFTSPSSLDMVHRLRRDCGAVLIGRGTVVADDPSLTVRRNVTCQQQPLRVVLDPSLQLLQEDGALRQYTLFHDDLPTVVYHSVDMASIPQHGSLPKSVTCVYLEPLTTTSPQQQSQTDRNKLNLSLVLDDLTSRFGVHHVMVEGGPATALGFLEDGLVDRALIVRAPRVCFPDPSTAIQAGTDAVRLQNAALEYLGAILSDGDTIECWSRPGLPWPTEQLSDWP